MLKLVALSLTIFIILISCSDYDKNQIVEIEKLSSPNKKYDAYFYKIESGMAFGSDVPAIKIVKFGEKPNFYDGDFFRLTSSPFQMRWDNDHLKIKTISNLDSLSVNQPIRTEIGYNKGVKINNEIYTAFSGTAFTDFEFQDFHEKSGYLIFRNNNDSAVIKIENSQVVLDSNFIEIQTFSKDKLETNKGLEFDGYKLIPKNKFDFKLLEKFQPLLKIKNN